MNKQDAKRIAEEVKNEELLEMFRRAKEQINNWEVVSRANKSLSRGVAWNILAKDFDPNQKYPFLAKVNMIREFGEFLPDYLKSEKKSRQPKSDGSFVHHEPDFNNW